MIFAGLKIRISGFNLCVKRSSIFLSSPCLPHALQHASVHLACCFGNSDKEVSSVSSPQPRRECRSSNISVSQESGRKIQGERLPPLHWQCSHNGWVEGASISIINILPEIHAIISCKHLAAYNNKAIFKPSHQ